MTAGAVRGGIYEQLSRIPAKDGCHPTDLILESPQVQYQPVHLHDTARRHDLAEFVKETVLGQLVKHKFHGMGKAFKILFGFISKSGDGNLTEDKTGDGDGQRGQNILPAPYIERLYTFHNRKDKPLLERHRAEGVHCQLRDQFLIRHIHIPIVPIARHGQYGMGARIAQLTEVIRTAFLFQLLKIKDTRIHCIPGQGTLAGNCFYGQSIRRIGQNRLPDLLAHPQVGGGFPVLPAVDGQIQSGGIRIPIHRYTQRLFRGGE